MTKIVSIVSLNNGIEYNYLSNADNALINARESDLYNHHVAADSIYYKYLNTFLI